MADLKKFCSRSSTRTAPNRSFFKGSLRTIGCNLVFLSIVLPWIGTAAAQQEPNNVQSRKVELEVQKLELEINKLTEDRGELPRWLVAVFAFLAGIVSAAASVRGTRRARIGALDRSVHNKRLAFYPKLVKATAPLAVYFSSRNPSSASVGPEECGNMGRAISKWYFSGGGLLLSVQARDAYFMLARALTRHH